MLIQILGIAGTFVSYVLWFPQARAVWKNKENATALKGISLATQYLVMASSIIWAAYAVAAEAFWIGAFAIVEFPLAIFTVSVVIKSRSLGGRNGNEA